MTLVCHNKLLTAGVRIIALHRLGNCHFSSGSRHLRLLMKCRQSCRPSTSASLADPFICHCHYSSSLPGTSSADKFKLPDAIERDRQHWIRLLREEQKAIEQRAKDADWFGGTTLECKMLKRKWSRRKTMMALSAGVPIERTSLKRLQPSHPIELALLDTSAAAAKSSSIFGKVKKITPDGYLLVLLDDDHGRDWEGVRFKVRPAIDAPLALEILENGEELHKIPGFPAMLWAYGCGGEWAKTYEEESHSINMDKMDDEHNMKWDKHQRTALAAALDPNRPIVAVHGPPGTGKSMLAMEYIRAEIQTGKRVAVVCGSNSAMYSLMGNYLQRTSSDPELSEHVLLHAPYDPQIADQLISDQKIKNAIENRTMKHLLKGQGSLRIYDKFKETATTWKLRTRSRIIRHYPLQICTPSKVTLSLIALAEAHFDVLVIEQANLLNEPVSWAMILSLAPCVRLFGDSHQPQMPLISKIAREQNLGRSLLQHFEEKDDQFCQGEQVNFHLRIQYRSHPAIQHWSNTVIYPNCKSEPAPSVVNLGLAELLSGKSDSKRPENLITEPMVMIDTSLVGNNGGGGWAERMFETKGRLSFFNDGEALLTASYLCHLHNFGLDPSQIAVFHNYTAQQTQIMTLISLLNKNEQHLRAQTFRTGDFLSRHFDIVVHSHVKDPREIYKGLRDLSYLSHTITRARRQFVLIANSNQLRESPMRKELDELIRTFEQKGRIMAPGELMPLRSGEFEKIMKGIKDQYFDSVRRGNERRKRADGWEEMKDEEENNSRKRRWKEAEMEGAEEERNGRRRKIREKEDDELEEEDEKKKSGRGKMMREVEEDELEEEDEKKSGRRKMREEVEDEDWKFIATRNQQTIANLEMKLRNKEQTIEQLEMKLREMRKIAKERGQSIWNLMEKLQERRKTMESLELRDVEKMAKGNQENGKGEKDVEEEDEGERR